MTQHLRPSGPVSVFGEPAPERPLRLGFLSQHNPFDRTAFSGTAHHAVRALMGHPDIALQVLGNHRPRSLADRLLRRPPPAMEPPRPEALSHLDAIVGLVATALLDRLPAQPAVPFLHVTDATPAFLRDSYGWTVPDAAFAAETRVAARAACTVYSSQAMAARAAADLCLPGLSSAAVPFGVNLDLEGAPAVEKPPLSPLRLLFVGADWVRKGGDTALAAFRVLQNRGIDARLTLVGRIPDHLRKEPGVHVAGFLNKNRAGDLRHLLRLYETAHLLLLPSRGDCTPMVLAEAMAHGTPALASDTGGIAELLGGGGAGRLMPRHASPGVWADAICEMTRTPEAYAFLSDAARDRAATHASWQAWAAGIHTLARDVVGAKGADAA